MFIGNMPQEISKIRMDYLINLALELKASYEPFMFKILIAAFLGGAIGYEREHHGQAAGFRTNIIVGLGACLLMQLSLHIEEIHQGMGAVSVVRVDPGRLASYAIASMGFLGAGAIIKAEGSVRGLTTAASLWLVTGMGLCVGAGVVFPAVLVTVISMAVLYIFPRFSKKFIRRSTYKHLIMVFDNENATVEGIDEILSKYPGLSIQDVNYRLDVPGNKAVFKLLVTGQDTTPWVQITNALKIMDGVESISFDDA